MFKVLFVSTVPDKMTIPILIVYFIKKRDNCRQIGVSDVNISRYKRFKGNLVPAMLANSTQLGLRPRSPFPFPLPTPLILSPLLIHQTRLPLDCFNDNFISQILFCSFYIHVPPLILSNRYRHVSNVAYFNKLKPFLKTHCMHQSIIS